MAEEGRGDIREHVSGIRVVGEIVDANRAAELVVLEPGKEGQAKVLGQFQIKGKEVRETQAVRRAYVVLQYIHGRIGEPRVDVEDRAGGDLPGDLELSPGDHTVRSVRRQVRKRVGADDRLFERHKHLPQRVQVAAPQAVDVGKVDVSVFARPDAHGGFELMVARSSGVAEQQRGFAPGQHLRVHDEHIVGAAGEVIQAHHHAREYLAVGFQVPGYVVRRAVETVPRGDNAMTLLVHLDVRVAENERRAGQRSLWIEEAHNTGRVLREIAG